MITLEKGFYAGTATPSSGGGGGGGGSTPTISVTNKSSSNVTSGEKVWINSSDSLEIVDYYGSPVISGVQGSLSVTDGVASNFSGSNYIIMGELDLANASSWSMETEITTGNGVGGPCNIFVEHNVSSSSGLLIQSNKIKANLSSTHSGFDIGNITGVTTISSNTKYKVKLEFTGTAYNLFLNDNLEGSITSSTKLIKHQWDIGAGGGLYPYPFNGSVDINTMHVTVSGEQVYPKLPINVNSDSFTGIAKEDIAINASGEVATVASPIKYGASVDNFLGDVDENGVLQEPSMVDGGIDLVFSGVKDIANDALYNRFTVTSQNHYINVKSISFPDLEQITGSQAIYGMCEYNPHLLSVSFPKLKIVTKNNLSAFYSCSNLKSVSLPELEKVSDADASIQSWFANSGLESISFPKLKELGNVSNSSGNGLRSGCSGCRSLTSASLPVLETLGWYGLSGAFSDSAITTMTFPSLKKIRGMYSMQQCFSNVTTLTSLSFPALVTNFFDWQGGGYIFQNMLSGCTGVTVHFPSNLQSVIGSWSDVTAGFGGTNTTILYDLTATE